MNTCYLLGIEYNLDSEDDYNSYIRDFRSHILMSYRYNFIKLVPSLLTSDTGWGCMIRSGQMILAETLLRNSLGRNWRLEKLNGNKNYSIAHKNILEYFLDIPNVNCYFSIHNIVQIGLNYNMKPGDWYGPETISYVLRDLVNNNKLIDISIYVAFNAIIFKNEIKDLCKNKNNFKILLLIPLRLGLNKINDIYIEYLLNFFKLNQFVGIIGGRPRKSLYFIGNHNKTLKYLDPHNIQETVIYDNCFPRMKELLSYHTMYPGSIDINNIDPSMTLGFYINDKNDLDTLMNETNKIFNNKDYFFEFKEENIDYDNLLDNVVECIDDWEVL